MEMVYKFRPGCRVGGDAQVVGEQLADLRAAKGRLHAPDVVDAARDPQSKLHRYFEWDDASAAEEYRTEQARHLIAAVVIVKTEDKGEITPVRAWCRVDSGYEAVEVVMSNPKLREQALREVRSTIKSAREKLASFEGFASILVGLDAVDAAIERKEQEERAVAPV